MSIPASIWYFIREFLIPLIVGTSVVWAPILIGYVAWAWWLEYVRKATITKAKWTMLNVKIPQEVFKSPAAFEIILNALHSETKPPAAMPPLAEIGKWWDTYWIGKWPLWFSLEIASIEGNIYFFFRVEPKNKETVENLIYSQFPQAEVTETEDYTAFVPPFKNGNGWDLRGMELKLTAEEKDPKDPDKKIPQDFIPLKTYVDYGLDEAFQLEEEQKIDPIVPLLQTLGSLGAGEQAWIQIVMQGASKRWDNPDPEKTDKVLWSEVGRKWVDALIAKFSKKEIIVAGDKEKGIEEVSFKAGGFRNLAEYDKPRVEAIERKIAKNGFDCTVRLVYLGHGSSFKAGKIMEVFGAFKQFGAPNLNSFSFVNPTDLGFDYPWQDYKDMKKIVNREKMFKRFVKRESFYPKEMGATVWIKKITSTPITRGSLKDPYVISLNTEELATIFHFPGRVAETSGVGRIEAQKAEPPANLPI